MSTATRTRRPTSGAVDEMVKRRRACGLSQIRLAQLAAVNPNTLCSIEKGYRPLSEGMAKRLDAILGAFERALREARAACA